MHFREAINQINYAANKAHQRHMVSGVGQLMVYQEKAEEAADFIAANYPSNLSDYPLIESEVDATGKSAKDVADGIIEKRSRWLATAAEIERIRMRGNALLKEDMDVKIVAEETIKALDAI